MASSSSLREQQSSTPRPDASNHYSNHTEGTGSRATDDTAAGIVPPRRSRGNRPFNRPTTGNELTNMPTNAHDDVQAIEVSASAQSGGRLPMPCYHAPDGTYELPPTHTIEHSAGWTPYNCHCGCIALWPTF